MNPIIRKAKVKDIPEIQRLYRQLDSHHAELLPDVFQAVDGDAREDEVIRNGIDRDDAEYLLAELDGQVVGFVNVERASHPKYPIFRPHEFAMIDNAVVDKRHRGKGIGTVLFRAAVDWTRKQGLRHVQTTVWHENVKAGEFYHDQGFRPMTVRLELETKGDTEPSAADGDHKPRA